MKLYNLKKLKTITYRGERLDGNATNPESAGSSEKKLKI